MSVPDFCARMSGAAARNTVNVPLRWVSMTGSHSSSRHVEEHALAQDPGDADDAVDPAERVDRGLHDARAALHRRDRVGDRHGVAAGGLDLVDHRVGDLAVGVLAVHAHAEVVDHDVRAGRRARERDRTADPPARRR